MNKRIWYMLPRPAWKKGDTAMIFSNSLALTKVLVLELAGSPYWCSSSLHYYCWGISISAPCTICQSGKVQDFIVTMKTIDPSQEVLGLTFISCNLFDLVFLWSSCYIIWRWRTLLSPFPWSEHFLVQVILVTTQNLSKIAKAIFFLSGTW